MALAASTTAANETNSRPISLSELAAKSDLVALAQVKDTDYFTRRDIPVSGSAYLKLLISYKGKPADAIFEIYENGLHEQECYFRDTSVFEEGRRYLVFLVRDPDDEKRYRGLPEGCALDVLVNSDNRYAVRYPPTGIELSDPLGETAIAMKFADGYALVEKESLSSTLRDALLAGGYIVPHNELQWRYTTGVRLSDISKLMGGGSAVPTVSLVHQSITGFIGVAAR